MIRTSRVVPGSEIRDKSEFPVAVHEVRRSETGGRAKASVVIACHTERRWSSLLSAIDSVLAQDPPPEEVLVIVDHNPGLLDAVSAECGSVTVAANRYARGASGARNTGVLLSESPLVAFLDDDAVARPGWLAELVAPFSDSSVVATGGRVEPGWSERRPAWFPDEFAWVVGASFRGMPTELGSVRNVWAENMMVRRSAFEKIGGFRIGFGKIADRSRPEDTDLCIRLQRSVPHGLVMYVPNAVVEHDVPVDRSTFGFFMRRCYQEGIGKIELSSHLGGQRDLGDEAYWIRRTVPQGIMRNLSAAFQQRSGAHAARVGGMMLGLGSAAVGVGLGLVLQVAGGGCAFPSVGETH